MKLFYRGLGYDYNPPAVAMVDGQVGGKFRGLDWRFRNLKQQPVQLPTLNLTYRGVSYQTGNVESVAPQTALVDSTSTQPVAAPLAEVSVKDMARSLMMSHHRWVKIRQQALLSRSAAEIGVRAGRGDNWDRVQGQVHSDFWDDYDHSYAALS